MHGYEGGSTDVDDEWAQRGMANVGAWILGRNMFGPVRGEWPDDSWKGWWGEEPPYQVPMFVLTHHPRQSIEMKGGTTTFHFVTDGIHRALEQAKNAAKDRDVRIGGGAATIQQYLRARLIDELHLAFRPILISGENLFAGIDLAALGYRCTQHVSTELAMHVVLKKAPPRRP
jgi:dihydrofolate reductase